MDTQLFAAISDHKSPVWKYKKCIISCIRYHRRHLFWRIYCLMKTYFTKWISYISICNMFLDLTMILWLCEDCYMHSTNIFCVEYTNSPLRACVDYHWNEAGILTTSSAASDENIVKIKYTLRQKKWPLFQTQNSKWCPHPICTILVEVCNACKWTFPTQNILIFCINPLCTGV